MEIFENKAITAFKKYETLELDELEPEILTALETKAAELNCSIDSIIQSIIRDAVAVNMTWDEFYKLMGDKVNLRKDHHINIVDVDDKSKVLYHIDYVGDEEL